MKDILKILVTVVINVLIGMLAIYLFLGWLFFLTNPGLQALLGYQYYGPNLTVLGILPAIVVFYQVSRLMTRKE